MALITLSTLVASGAVGYIVYKNFHNTFDLEKEFREKIGNDTTTFDTRVESQIGDIKLDLDNPYRKRHSVGVTEGGVTTTRGYMGIPKQTYHTEDGGRIQIYAKDPFNNPFVDT